MPACSECHSQRRPSGPRHRRGVCWLQQGADSPMSEGAPTVAVSNDSSGSADRPATRQRPEDRPSLRQPVQVAAGGCRRRPRQPAVGGKPPLCGGDYPLVARSRPAETSDHGRMQLSAAVRRAGRDQLLGVALAAARAVQPEDRVTSASTGSLPAIPLQPSPASSAVHQPETPSPRSSDRSRPIAASNPRSQGRVRIVHVGSFVCGRRLPTDMLHEPRSARLRPIPYVAGRPWSRRERRR